MKHKVILADSFKYKEAKKLLKKKPSLRQAIEELGNELAEKPQRFLQNQARYQIQRER
jgi:hypothetical protein